MLAEIPDAWEARARPSCSALAPAARPRLRRTCCGRRSSAPGRRRTRTCATGCTAYAEKAMREAGDRTTWTAPDADYEAAVHAAVDAAFDDPRVARGARRAASRRIAGPGWSNALAAKLLALTMPGRPRRLPGQRAVGAEPGRPRQPPAGRLRPRARRCSTGADARAHRPASTTPARPSCWSPARRCRCAATGPSCSPATTPLAAEGPAADHVLAFDRGGAVTVVTRLPGRPGRRAAAGATPRCGCPPAAGPTQVSGRTVHRPRAAGRPARRPARRPAAREERAR